MLSKAIAAHVQRRARLGARAASALGLLIACGCAPEAGRGATGEEQAQLSSLARDYLFKAVDEPEASAILGRIRALSPRQAERFHALLLDMNGYDANQRWISSALFQRALTRGVSFLDLSAQEVREVMASLVHEEAQ